MSAVASPPRSAPLELDPDATPRKASSGRPTLPASSVSSRSPPNTKAGSLRSSANAPTLAPLQIGGEAPFGSGFPSPTLSFTLPSLPDVNFASGSDISDSETDAGSSGLSQLGRRTRAPSKATTADGYSSESSACMDSEDDAATGQHLPKITFHESAAARSRAKSVVDGGARLRRVPSPSPLAQTAAQADDHGLSKSWSRSLSLFRRKRSAPDLRTAARAQTGSSDQPLPPPLPAASRGRFARALSVSVASTANDPPAPPPPLPATAPLLKELKNKSSMKSLRSRSPFRPQTPNSPPPPTPPPLPLDEDPFACLPTPARSSSPHPSLSRRARQPKASNEAGPSRPSRARSLTSPSSDAPPASVFSLLAPPEPSPAPFLLTMPSPKKLVAPQPSPITPTSDASDERPTDDRGRTRSYGGDKADGAPPPPGPNRPSNPPRRSLPPARQGNDEDEDDGRPPPRRAAVKGFDDDNSSSSSSSEDSSSESESDFKTPLETTPDDDDDDVPLAMAHPTTALKAQKSLRLTRRKEKTEERSRRKADRRRADSPETRRRTGAATSASTVTIKSARRLPKDLPSAYGVSGMDGVFRAEELERKLRELELKDNARPSPTADAGVPHFLRSRTGSEAHSPYAVPAGGERVKGSSLPLPPTLSRKASVPNLGAPPLPSSSSSPFAAQSSLSRARSQSAAKAKPPPAASSRSRQVSATRPHSPTYDPSTVPMQRKASEPLPAGPVGRQRSQSSARRPSTNPADVPPLPPLPGASTNFPSPSPAASAPQSSGPGSRRPTLNGLGPVPELDRLRIAPNPTRTLAVTLEHGDVPRTIRVEVPDVTTAGGLIELLKQRGDLPSGRTGENLLKGELAVWERGDEWSVERPLRDYEVLTQITAAWNPNKRENAFVVKRCTLCECLTMRAIPGQCPNVVGWVQVYSTRKKKWSKRYLEVRGGGVSLAKNERGKDEQHLCTLTAFDFYLVTKIPAKAPKGSYFALKSQDQSAFFEDSSDYIHLFATDSRTFDRMYRGILDARSHALTTSNPSLFAVRSPSSAAGSRGPSSAHSPIPPSELAAFGTVRRPSAAGSGSPAGAPGQSAAADGAAGLWQQGSLLSKISRG